MYFPEENYSHSNQENFISGYNCESKPMISINLRKYIPFTPCQLNELEQIFHKNKNQVPSIYIRKELAKKMGVSPIKIRMWFYHKTRMWKRASGSDCKSESKSGNKFRRFKYNERIELKRIFEKNYYPDTKIRNDLAQRMGVSEVKIQRWFLQERQRLKKHVSSLTCAESGYDNFITSSTDESGYDNFITSSTDDVNYPPTPFYSRAETMPLIYPYQFPQSQSQSDFPATFSAEQYSSHHVPLTHQWTDSDTQLSSTVGSPIYSFPATVTYPQSVLTPL